MVDLFIHIQITGSFRVTTSCLINVIICDHSWMCQRFSASYELNADCAVGYIISTENAVPFDVIILSAVSNVIGTQYGSSLRGFFVWFFGMCDDDSVVGHVVSATHVGCSR